MGGNSKRRKEKEKQKDATQKVNEEFLGFRYSSYVREDQPKDSIVLRRLGGTGEFVKDTAIDRRVVRRGAVVKPEVLREAFIVQNFQFILRPTSFYEPCSSSSQGFSSGEYERSILVAQGLVDDFPPSDSASPKQSLSVALADFNTKIHWRHIIAVSTRMDVDDMRCPICFESPTAPRVTPCGHIFCFHCILRSMNAQKRLGIGYNGGGGGTVSGLGGRQESTTSLASTGSLSRQRQRNANAGNALGSGDAYGSRPRTCPLCGCGVDLQSLRPCFISPSHDELSDNTLVRNPIHSFGLVCRHRETPILIPAGGSEQKQDARAACVGDPTPALTAATLLSNPRFVPQHGTPMARYSRYVHSTREMLQDLFQTEITDVERQLRLLKSERVDPSLPLDEGETFEHNALQGVFSHLSTYGYSTITTCDCESVNQHVISLRLQKQREQASLIAAQLESQPPQRQLEGSFAESSCPHSGALCHPTSSDLVAVGDVHAPAEDTCHVSQPNGVSSCSIVNCLSTSPLVWMYRLSDGQHAYLHPLNTRMLLRQAEMDCIAARRDANAGSDVVASHNEKENLILNFASYLRSSFEARVLDVEICTQQPATHNGGSTDRKKKMIRAFAHVPPHATYTEVFVDLGGNSDTVTTASSLQHGNSLSLMTPIVSKEVLNEFKQQIAVRLRDIYRKRRRAEGCDHSASNATFSNSSAVCRNSGVLLASSGVRSGDRNHNNCDGEAEEEGVAEKWWGEAGSADEEVFVSDDNNDAVGCDQSVTEASDSPSKARTPTSQGAAYTNERAVSKFSQMSAEGLVSGHSADNAQYSDYNHDCDDDDDHYYYSDEFDGVNSRARLQQINKVLGSGYSEGLKTPTTPNRKFPKSQFQQLNKQQGHKRDPSVKNEGHSVEKGAGDSGAMVNNIGDNKQNTDGNERTGDKVLARPQTDSSMESCRDSVPPSGGGSDDMLALLAVMGDLTMEEQLWLMEEQERSKRVAAGDTSLKYETPALAEQWGAVSTAAVAGYEASLVEDQSSKVMSQQWGSRRPLKQLCDTEAFPTLGGGGDSPNVSHLMVSKDKKKGISSEVRGGSTKGSSRGSGGWTTVTSQPARRSWKEDLDDELDKYFSQPKETQGASTGSAWGKRK